MQVVIKFTVHRSQSSSYTDGLLLQDIGCCFGQDIRQLISDGWNDEELIAIDLVPDYW